MNWLCYLLVFSSFDFAECRIQKELLQLTLRSSDCWEISVHLIQRTVAGVSFLGSPAATRPPVCILQYCILLGPRSIILFAYWDLDPRSVAGMPPKKRLVEPRGDEEVERETTEYEFNISSPASSASARSCGSLTSEQLEKILESNHKAMLEANYKSMTALLATLTPPSPETPGTARGAQIKIPKWTDDETPFEYFGKFEKALKHNGVEKKSWGQLLPVYLAGRAQAAFAQVDSESLEDYESVKATLLEFLGDTPASADRRWWSLSRQVNEEPGSFYLRVRATGLRRLHGLATREEILEKVILSRFLSLLPAECYSCVVSKQPKNGLEAARLVQEYEETRSFSRRRQPWKQDSSYHSSHSVNRREQGGGGTGGGASSVNTKEGAVSQNSSAGTSVNNGSKNVKVEKQNRKPVTCYGCGELGHIRPNCPNKVRRVRSPVKDSLMEVDGCLAGFAVKGLKVDTGADRTIVCADFVPKSAYLKKTVILDSWRGKQFSKHRMAKLVVKVGKTEVTAVVAVAEKLDCPALLGNDLGPAMGVELLSMVLERARAAQSESCEEVVKMNVVESEVESVRATRAQVGRERMEDEQNVQASAQSESEPLPLSEIIDIPDSYFEQDPLPTPIDECSTLPEGCVVDVPLPTMICSDSNSLIQEQQADVSLKPLWQFALKKEKGYSFDSGVLVHSTSDGLGDSLVRILVPVNRRLCVLEMANSNMLAGHFGVKKTFGRISSKFLWPKMRTEVKAYVRTCVGCQRASRKDNARAPLQPLQCVDEPFQKVAFDLVGPLPKSSSGHRYLLTMMCLYTKFPAAIPLKRVDNETVIEAMMEIFSRYGVPKVLLTDQGSVFTSKLTKAMCKDFEIEKIQTSPYHPQSDGALERWHACLKGMLKRSQCNLKLWDRELKYLLFAYRSTPHCVTGFSPFTLMFGRYVRGPLEILQEAWLQGECEPAKVHEWLINVKAKMSDMAEVVSDRERVAKSNMKKFYDRTAKVKVFEEGEMVLVWKPGIHSKMGASWEGPFQIESKMSPVTYRVQVPGKAHQSKVLHSNLLKKWSTSASKVHRVACIIEEEGEEEPTTGLILGRHGFVPSEMQQAKLQDVLKGHKDVIQPEPGRTDELHLSINTGISEPVRSHPYRIPPRWKNEVKVQIDKLLELGIIRPSTSPWSSSVVTVKKKEGGVRICIDYRAVNQITQPDPYLMPLIDEILDTLASAKFLSKIDLNKGFHQIPIQTDDIMKTAFCTPWGKFEFTVMPFGLRNGPAMFQRLMDRLLHKDLDFARVYIDDIVVFSSTWEEHCKHIDLVLKRLRTAGLTANEKKCQWGQTKCTFLGHVVGEGEVSPAEFKVLAVRDFCQPQT